MIFFAVNTILALMGFFISYKIMLKKKSSEKMVCSNLFNCQDVLDSKFSKLFFIDIEKLGLLYYFFIFCGYAWIIFFSISENIMLYVILLASSVAGLCFSVYLILAQGLYIKNWCKFCVSSALVSILIFIISLLSITNNYSDVSILLNKIINTLSTAQVFAISLGTSAATLSAILTIFFLKDFKIDLREEKKLFLLDQLIWLAILILIIVNIGLYIANPISYINTNLIISQLGILGFLLINNIILSLYVLPKLIGSRIDFKSIHVSNVFWLRQLGLALGVVSIVSWYSILLTNYFIKQNNYDFSEILSYYLAISLVIIILTQIAIIAVDQNKNYRDNVYKFK